MEKSVSEIAALVGGKVVGDGSVRITGLQGIKEAGPGDLTFLADGRFQGFLESTGASAVLVPAECHPDSKTAVQVSNPYHAFAHMLAVFESEVRFHPVGIHPAACVAEGARLGDACGIGAHAVIESGARLGDRVVVYPGVYIGNSAGIGDDTIIYPNATIRERVIIGKRCVIHSNAAIGSDGFGFLSAEGVHHKIPQVGTVEIGDDVEIGSNTSIDRATCGVTRIGHGTKIDNMVQVGHNVVIGDHCTISGYSGIAGSATIGHHVTIGGKVGVGGHIEIGDGAVVAGASDVIHSVESNAVVSGYGPVPHELNKRIAAGRKRLPDALRRLRQLEQRVEQLEDPSNG